MNNEENNNLSVEGTGDLDSKVDVSSPIKPGSIVIYLDAESKFRFRIKSANGEIVGHSEGYNTKWACQKGIRAILKIASSADIQDTVRDNVSQAIGMKVFEIFKDVEDKFRFRLNASNLETILASQAYKSKDGCLTGIRSVKNISLNYKLIDETKK
ncbi:MAG: YegP family protein [Christensenellaceae bacterium]|nr:YegP family protein [Christensenellaceae bacterium]